MANIFHIIKKEYINYYMEADVFLNKKDIRNLSLIPYVGPDKLGQKVVTNY